MTTTGIRVGALVLVLFVSNPAAVALFKNALTDCGARANDTDDDTVKLRDCLSAAKPLYLLPAPFKPLSEISKLRV